MAKGQILVVEDEPIIAEYIRTLLQEYGYSVLGPSDTGASALKNACEIRPDLVLMDITLKGPMDGIEAARQIRESLSLPVVFLTAHSDDQTLERAKRIGPHGYLLKPFNDRELYSTVETALYRAAMERKVKETERWMKVLLGGIRDAVIAVNALGTVAFLNRAAEKLTGWTQEEAAGRDWGEVCRLHNPGTGGPADVPFMEIILDDGGQTLGQALRLRPRDAAEKTVEASFAPMRDEEGTVLGLVVTLRDAEGKA